MEEVSAKPPKEDQNCKRGRDFFGGQKAEERPEAQQQKVKQDVVVLRRDPKSRCLPLLDKARQPCIVGVAAEVGRFDARKPETGNQGHYRNQYDKKSVPCLPIRADG